MTGPIRLSRAYLVNLAGLGLPLLLTVVTIPLYIGLIGAERYGVMAIALMVLGYAGLLDFGLSRATTRRIAELRHAPRQVRANVVAVALAANLALGALFGIVFFALASHYFAAAMPLDPVLRDEAAAALPLLAISFPLTTLTAALVGALQGEERFASAAIAGSGGASLALLLPLLTAALITTSLPALAAATIAGRVFAAAVAGRQVWRDILRGQRPGFDRGEFRALTGFANWVAVSSFSSAIMIMSDRFMIGASFGAAATTAYSVPYQIASRLSLFSDALATTVFPRLSAQANGDAPETLSIRLAVWTGLLLSAPLCLLSVLLEPLLQLWLGPVFDPRSVLLGQMILVGVWANCIAAMPFAQIQARGDSRFTGLLHLAELPLLLLAMVLLGQKFGLPGIAAAFCLRSLGDLLALCLKAYGGQTARLAVLLIPFAGLLAAPVLAGLPGAQAAIASMVLAGALGLLAVLQLRRDGAFGARPARPSAASPVQDSRQ